MTSPLIARERGEATKQVAIRWCRKEAAQIASCKFSLNFTFIAVFLLLEVARSSPQPYPLSFLYIRMDHRGDASSLKVLCQIFAQRDNRDVTDTADRIARFPAHPFRWR